MARESFMSAERKALRAVLGLALCELVSTGEEAVNASGLSRGKGRTDRPRVYAGCVPCHQGRWCADLEHANIWIETHWKRCRGPLSARGPEAV